MTDSKKTGYALLDVHFLNASFSVRTAEDENISEVAAGDNGEARVSFRWDWRPVGPRSFQVIVGIATIRHTEVIEETGVEVVGMFSAGEEALEASVPFAEFVRFHAPAILLPYAREAISSMTGRGPLRSLYLPPMNVRLLVQEMDPEATTGARELRDEKSRKGFKLI